MIGVVLFSPVCYCLPCRHMCYVDLPPMYRRAMEQHESVPLILESFRHAFRAYKLEVLSETSLPTLSSERLTPPTTRLLMAMLGTLNRASAVRRHVYQRVAAVTDEIVSQGFRRSISKPTILVSFYS